MTTDVHAGSRFPFVCGVLPCRLGGVSPVMLRLLGECRTLWGEREQAMHYSIDCFLLVVLSLGGVSLGSVIKAIIHNVGMILSMQFFFTESKNRLQLNSSLKHCTQ